MKPLTFEENIELEFSAKNQHYSLPYGVQGLIFYNSITKKDKKNGFHKELILKIKNISREKLTINLEFIDLKSDIKFLIKSLNSDNGNESTCYSRILSPGKEKQVILYVKGPNGKKANLKVKDLKDNKHSIFNLTISNNRETTLKQAPIEFKSHKWVSDNRTGDLHNPYTPLLPLEDQPTSSIKAKELGKRTPLVSLEKPNLKRSRTDEENIEIPPFLLSQIDKVLSEIGEIANESPLNYTYNPENLEDLEDLL